MIKKIIKVKNFAKFKPNFSIKCGNWNNEFKRYNIIYGENGSGKTSFSLLLRSFSGDNDLLKRKKSFGSDSPIKIEIIDDKNNRIVYNDGKWSSFNENIDVFDIHFIEDNIYIGSSLPSTTRSNLFEIVVGKEGLIIKEKLKILYVENEKERKARKSLKNRLKYDKAALKKDVKKDLNQQIEKLTSTIDLRTAKIKKLNIELASYSQNIFKKYIKEINDYLQFFTPNIKIQKFSNKSSRGKQLVSYSLSVGGERVVFNQNSSNRNIKYTLSEGDKSAFAFAFFLAKLEFKSLTNTILVFDDPISSFDQARRNATINQLLVIGKKCKQVFILSHDINFAKNVYLRSDKSQTLSLKINTINDKSCFSFHDIEHETLTGIFKDIFVLDEYLKNGATTDLEKREIIRCIRPIIEGILRIKFFQVIRRDEWLGDIIKKINVSGPNDLLYRLKSLKNEICEINDYSKIFHHSDPTNPWGETINDQELHLYVIRTLDLIQKI